MPTDERGKPRPEPDGLCGIGAIERQDTGGDLLPLLRLPPIMRRITSGDTPPGPEEQ